MPRRRRGTMGMRKLKIERFLKNTFNRKSNGNLISQLKIDRQAQQLQVSSIISCITDSVQYVARRRRACRRNLRPSISSRRRWAAIKLR